MASKELQKKNDKDLNKDLKQKREALRDFRFGLSGSKTNKPHEFKRNKKDVARILTELNKRKEK